MADHPYTGLRPFLPDEADIFLVEMNNWMR